MLATLIPSPNQALLSFTAGSVFGLVFVYYTLQHLLKVRRKPLTERQRSWVLTTISSAVMTASSLPYLWRWLRVGDVDVLHYVAERACCFFVAYLLSDLAIGTLHYRSSISLLTGWVHHTVYIALITLLAIPHNYSTFFCLCSILELPTFLLALGNLHARLRNDYLFAAVFLLTRIVLHIYIAVDNALKVLSATPGPTWTPTIVLACILPMHLLWMHNCLTGILRRRKASLSPPYPPSALTQVHTANASLARVDPAAPHTHYSPLMRIRNIPSYVLSRRLVTSALASVRARRTALLRRSRLRIRDLLRRLEDEGLAGPNIRDALRRALDEDADRDGVVGHEGQRVHVE